MPFTYIPLQKLLVEKRMTGTELRKLIQSSSATLAKINADQYISMEVLDRICGVLNCKIEDVIEYIPDTPKN